MTRLVVVAAAAGALAVTVPASALAPPARVQVVADEFNLTLSRTAIKSGRAIVELVNYGEDLHDLKFRRQGGTRIYAIRVLESGEHADVAVKLLPGRFALWCSVADHRARGMAATLVVKK